MCHCLGTVQKLLFTSFLITIDKDLEIYREGLHASSAPEYNKLCPEGKKTEDGGLYPCYMVTMLVEEGKVYITSLFGRNGGILKDGVITYSSANSGGEEALIAGYLLEIYEMSLKHHIPDMEFTLYWGDHYEVNAADPDLSSLRMQYSKPMDNTDSQNPDSLLPVILQFNKQKKEPFVLMPHSSHHRCFENNVDDLLSRLGEQDENERKPWDQRQAKAFGAWTVFCPYWTWSATWGSGRPMNCPREKLLEIARENSTLLDLHSVEEKKPFEHYYQSKYAVYTDGFAASTQLEKLMLTGAAVLKQSSPRYTYFHHLLKPWEHYVPFWENNTHDIVGAVQWLRSHDQEAQRMAMAAGSVIRRYVNRQARLCYWARLLQRIGGLMKYTPVRCKDRKVCASLKDQLVYMGKHVKLNCSRGQSLAQHVERLLMRTA
ncbi:hypothetical protein CEUSTIGMA_g4519.t1 [Chlamydomonas eustigma]|uniref:Glycosyl transferase CAP10 domain-containing protein n=1 Tax=Chlamydomonas eustigma TaxID=1157962 RepID=A0A250X1V9_9CHLO|nr:hypothetical protein CEUSTIGMA_g4519.t1 [Chlamydomonas eustigma]|eukprot:GAX77073.1 hypothetical protein CEUSTIGMA_g4519.t1 [Chlamydomonas eustigma]